MWQKPEGGFWGQEKRPLPVTTKRPWSQVEGRGSCGDREYPTLQPECQGDRVGLATKVCRNGKGGQAQGSCSEDEVMAERGSL